VRAGELAAWLASRVAEEGDVRVLIAYDSREWLDVDGEDMPYGASLNGEPVILIPAGDAA
jgi:hypothetical protein